MQSFIPTPPLFTNRPKPLTPRNKTLPRATLSNVLVVGANRGLGLEIASLLHDRQTPNLKTTSRETSFTPPTLAAISQTYHLDALDRDTTFQLIGNALPEVIISCIGGSVSTSEYPDFKGNQNLIDAAVASGVRRFVLISALGAGDSEGSVPFQVMDTMRPLLLEKSHAEAYLKASEIEWTIARPGPIVEGEGGVCVATEEKNCYGTVTRGELARVVADMAASERVGGKTLHVVDVEKVLITSPYVRPLEFWETLPFVEFQL